MLRAALAVCAAIAGALIAPTLAVAGSYEVRACSPEANSGLWTPVNTAPAGYASGNLCGGPEIGPLDGAKEGSLYAEDILNSPADIPNGSRAGWTITAPPGATITRIAYYRTLRSYVDKDKAAGLFLANGSPLEQCRIAVPFGSPITCSMPNNQAPIVFSNLNTSSLFFGVLCDIVTQGVLACGAGGAPLHEVQAYMYSARVTIAENSAPTVTDVGGALWGGGIVSGTVPVTFAAADGSGIREQAVQHAGGQTLVSTLHGCDFTLQPPCPQSPASTLSLDTTRVPDGTQTFRLVVTDAAGNSQVVVSPPVTIDNFGPPPPVGLTAAHAGSNTIALAWSNPVNPPLPIAGAMAQLCSTTCAPPVTVNASGTAQLTAPGPGAYSARVWLLDTAGRGGPHNTAATTVTVPSTASPPPPPPSPPGATKTKIRALLHGRRLRVIGPITGSGRVTVSWRSKVRGRTVGHGSRTVTIRHHRLGVTFAIPRAARTRAATIRVAVRRVKRIVGQARARRA